MIKNIEIINVGDELLLGIRPNTHLDYLGQTFSEYGITVKRGQVIRDSHTEIADALAIAWKKADLVITTGGLGPTADDLTRESIAEFLGVSLEYRDEVRIDIEARFRKLGRNVTTNNMKQCYLFKGSEILHNANGTAPGIYFERDGKILAVLPGPPRELKPIVEDILIPKLIKSGHIEHTIPFINIRTCGIGESALETLVDPVLEKHPGIYASYCVHSGYADVRLSSPGDLVELARIQNVANEVAAELGEEFVGFGEPEIEKMIIEELGNYDFTISCAESATGGMVAAALTKTPGASKVFQGGVVCYSNEAKIHFVDVPESIIEQHGEVSAETAVTMATGVAERLGTDFAISTTGYAGPTGGNDKDPVGTVYLGFHSPAGVWSRRIVLPGDRQLLRHRFKTYALDMVRRKFKKYKTQHLKHHS